MVCPSRLILSRNHVLGPMSVTETKDQQICQSKIGPLFLSSNSRFASRLKCCFPKRSLRLQCTALSVASFTSFAEANPPRGEFPVIRRFLVLVPFGSCFVFLVGGGLWDNPSWVIVLYIYIYTHIYILYLLKSDCTV